MMPDLATMVRDALRVVLDPELGYNIVDLGFVYDITVLDGDARITMTATTPSCPAAGFLKEGVASSARQVPGIRSVEVVMTFDPPWEPSMIAPRCERVARVCSRQLIQEDGTRLCHVPSSPALFFAQSRSNKTRPGRPGRHTDHAWTECRSKVAQPSGAGRWQKSSKAVAGASPLRP